MLKTEQRWIWHHNYSNRQGNLKLLTLFQQKKAAGSLQKGREAIETEEKKRKKRKNDRTRSGRQDSFFQMHETMGKKPLRAKGALLSSPLARTYIRMHARLISSLIS